MIYIILPNEYGGERKQWANVTPHPTAHAGWQDGVRAATDQETAVLKQVEAAADAGTELSPDLEAALDRILGDYGQAA